MSATRAHICDAHGPCTAARGRGHQLCVCHQSRPNTPGRRLRRTDPRRQYIQSRHTGSLTGRRGAEAGKQVEEGCYKESLIISSPHVFSDHIPAKQHTAPPPRRRFPRLSATRTSALRALVPWGHIYTPEALR
jgi:hypothetical protein